jgi:hypothetical protein
MLPVPAIQSLWPSMSASLANTRSIGARIVRSSSNSMGFMRASILVR